MRLPTFDGMTTEHAPVHPAPQPLAPSVPTGLATVTQVLAVALAALMLVRAAAMVVAGGDPQAWVGDQPSAAVMAVGALTSLTMLVQLLAGGLGCVWLYLHVTTARALNPDGWHDRAPYWAFLGWVAPIVSLWFPYQVVRDGAASVGAPTRVVGWWWATWLTLQVVVAGEAVAALLVVDDATPFLVAAMVTALATAVSGALWVRVVRSMTDAATRCAVARVPTPTVVP